jgi:hypothetical protein
MAFFPPPQAGERPPARGAFGRRAVHQPAVAFGALIMSLKNNAILIEL